MVEILSGIFTNQRMVVTGFARLSLATFRMHMSIMAQEQVEEEEPSLFSVEDVNGVENFRLTLGSMRRL